MNERTGTPPPERRRRARYAGTHPRRFDEKYKERDPERYPETVRKVLDSGKTPAGSHVPILLPEVLEVLAPRPGEVAVDATLGYGGHAGALLARLQPGGRLIGLDVDPIEIARTAERLRRDGLPDAALTVRRGSFAGLSRVLHETGAADGVDVLLADLGVSSMQLDDPARGFSFKRDGPLDLRMNPAHGAPASTVLARLSETQLARLLADLSDEPHAAAIARAIVEAREREPIATTTALAAAVRAALETLPERTRREEGDSPVARTFQALRIRVNDELTALSALLAQLPSALRPGGRVALLSFHSGEDRLVKKAFQAGLKDGTYRAVAPDVIRAGPEERRANPRSASAKLRWAVRA